jgi:putative transcriptional regulator
MFCDKSQRKSKMSERNIGQEILEGIRDIKAHKAGKKALRFHTLKEPSPPQVIRARLKLSQSAFAGLMGVSLRTVQDWEQGRRKPSGPAEALLRIAEQKPEVFTQLT